MAVPLPGDDAWEAEMSTAATATISFHWDDRWKCWRVTGSRSNARATDGIRVDTSSPIDRAGMLLILEAIKNEMSAWLF